MLQHGKVDGLPTKVLELPQIVSSKMADVKVVEDSPAHFKEAVSQSVFSSSWILIDEIVGQKSAQDMVD
jgi:hypothetical protein